MSQAQVCGLDHIPVYQVAAWGQINCNFARVRIGIYHSVNNTSQKCQSQQENEPKTILGGEPMGTLTQMVKSILGIQGTQVMETLVKAEPVLASYISPRAIIGWLRQADYGDLQLGDSCFTQLSKSGYGFSGAVTIHNIPFRFEYVSEEHIAALATIASGDSIQQIEYKDIDLAKLAKTIDLLVKANKPKDRQFERMGTAQNLEHQEPTKPDTVQDQPGKPAKPVEAAKAKTLKIPGIKTKTPSAKPSIPKPIKLSRSETQRVCSICHSKMFQDDRFTGCTCFRPLSKGVTTTCIIPGQITLSFDRTWDNEAVMALVGALKHGQ